MFFYMYDSFSQFYCLYEKNGFNNIVFSFKFQFFIL